ncbi:MAG: putative motility protein [Brevibacillus sp.]|nr:putative motility protein [Brevibacillus sp.]
MNMVQLKQAINISLMKQVQDTAAAQASTMLADFAKTQQNIQQAASAPHPTLGKHLDVRV